MTQLRKYDSATSLSIFSECRYRYLAKYLAKIPEDNHPYVESAGRLGTLIHEAILNFSIKSNYCLENTLNKIKSEFSEQMMLTVVQKLESLMSLIISDIDGDDSTKIYCEERVDFEYFGWKLRCFIDQIIVKEDKVIITDYKSGRYTDNFSMQTDVYFNAIKSLFPHHKILFRYLYFFDERQVIWTHSDIEKECILEKTLYQLTEAIEKAEFPRTFSDSCDFCPFRSHCYTEVALKSTLSNLCRSGIHWQDKNRQEKEK